LCHDAERDAKRRFFSNHSGRRDPEDGQPGVRHIAPSLVDRAVIDPIDQRLPESLIDSRGSVLRRVSHLTLTVLNSIFGRQAAFEQSQD
jgi:hypothetical protein